MKLLAVESGNCYLFKDEVNRRYLSGVDIAEGYFLYSENPVYFTDLRYFSAAKVKLEKAGITAKVLHGFPDITAEIKAQGITAVKIDFTRTTVSEYFTYKKLFSEIDDCSKELSALRAVKSAAEIENIKRACEISEKAVEKTFALARAGITERELLKILEDITFSLGAEGMAFDTIVAFGENAAVPHHETGDAKLAKNQVVLIDTGCTINGCCSDITRTAFFGMPDREFLRAYNAVLLAGVKAEREIYAGISGKDADKIARDELISSGYGEYFTHSLGHGVGLEIHENPYLSPKSNDILTDGAVFTVEPGVYIEGKFGIRIEDTCVMENGRAKRLFNDDKKPLVIKAEK